MRKEIFSVFAAVSAGVAFAADPAWRDLPIVDLTRDAYRHTVIAPGTKDVYQGHPTTVLSNDGKKLFCVWTPEHGGKCGPAAESLDGGRTWTRVDDRFPKVYSETHMNCPTLQKMTLPGGKERWLIFSRKGKWNPKVADIEKCGVMLSDDLGMTWREAGVFNLHAAMAPTGFLQLKDGSVALFGQTFKIKTAPKRGGQDVWMSISKDGGLSWGEPRIVASANKDICEPFALRSPDGSEICLLMRENGYKGYSMMCFSRDEGKTWSKPVDSPWWLTGDRHEGIILPDGRYVIAFRDRARRSKIGGQYVAWVGTWDDIKNRRMGQYRIHLFQHYPTERYGWSRFDTGYSGVELLPSGEILCTTYVKYWPDERRSSVVCTRFQIEETDRMAKLLSANAHVRGRIAQSEKYANLHPRFPKAFEFMRRADLPKLPCGRYEIDGTNSWALIMDVALKPFAEKNQYEVHRDFIDIQAPISGNETIGVAKPAAGMFAGANAGKSDILFQDKGEQWTLVPEDFAVFFPKEGAHAPGLTLEGQKTIRKLVIKVRK